VKGLFHDGSKGVFASLLPNTAYLATQPGIGYVMFSSFINDISVSEIPPTYKFFQTLITHAPLVLKPDCTLRDDFAENLLPPMRDQVQCSLKLVKQFFDKLKKLGIYDSTLIVISSDHGGNYLDPDLTDKLNEKNIPLKHFARAQATLLIKPLHADGELTISNYPAQLSDIPQTISSLVDFNSIEYGENIFETQTKNIRERSFYFIDWGFGMKKSDRLSGFIKYCISGDSSNPDSWGLSSSGLEGKCY
jgi:phosphoglycerol transferase MdoB-like AlkP superfamily enzyme